MTKNVTTLVAVTGDGIPQYVVGPFHGFDAAEEYIRSHSAGLDDLIHDYATEYPESVWDIAVYVMNRPGVLDV